jgi:hypothetical protein
MGTGGRKSLAYRLLFLFPFAAFSAVPIA